MSNSYYSKTTTNEVVFGSTQQQHHHNTNVASRTTVVANPYATNTASQSCSSLHNPPKQPCVTPVSNRKIPSHLCEDLYIHTHHKQIVPVGKKRKVDVQDEDDNSVGTVMPCVFATECKLLLDDPNALAQMTYNDHDRVINFTWTITNPSVLQTTINVEGYTNCITDPEYICKRHAIINGKIHEWHKATNDLLTHIESNDVMQDVYQP
jgi:hypothetical protein